MLIRAAIGAVSQRLTPLMTLLASLILLSVTPLSKAATDDLNPPIDQTEQTPLASVPPHPPVAAMEDIGRRMFFDTKLSASQRMSCATCHDPHYAYGPANARPVQLGGIKLRSEGPRAVPSLRYQQNVPFFTEHYHDEDFDDSVDAGPTGGHTWDGRAITIQEQARLPLLANAEMANAGIEQVVASIKHSSYADDFRRTFGEDIFENPQAAFKAGCKALEMFQQNPVEFYPYTSKYDAFLRGQTKLSKRERLGLALFNDPKKGNCASCHQSAIGASGAFPSFSDFGFIALGVPRNRQLQANTDPGYYDLGLCGPFRRDLTDKPEYCGLFRTPSLRNVALRKAFFHNGVFHDLTQVLRFYVERDIHPEKWYARDSGGGVQKYDDLPNQYHKNINNGPPFDKGPKDQPALTAAEIKDVIAFLKTLTDGWAGAK